MLPRLLSCLCLALLCAAPLAADSQDSAWQARDLLGPERWAQVVRVESNRMLGRSTVIHALVFELEGRLWFYAEHRGTESLSLEDGRLAQDKADLLPLLRHLDPAVTRYQVVPRPAAHFASARLNPALPNGCFIESVAYFQRLVDTGRAPDEARLLAYYGVNGADAGGHTILYYERAGRRYFYDPAGAAAPARLADDVHSDPLAIADAATPAFARHRPQRAKFLPLRIPSSIRTEWADYTAFTASAPISDSLPGALAN